MAFHRTITAAITLAALASLAACGDDTDPDAKPTEEPTSAVTTAPSSPTPSAWESEYTEKQLATYEEALQRWTDFLRQSEPIWRRGKVTPEAEELFKAYWYTPQGILADLQLLEDNELTKNGNTPVLWSRPARVEGGAVTIEQCIDATGEAGALVNKDGTIRPGKIESPYIATVDLSKPQGGGPFLIETYRTAANLEQKELASCSAE